MVCIVVLKISKFQKNFHLFQSDHCCWDSNLCLESHFWAGLNSRMERSHLMSKTSVYHEIWLVFLQPSAFLGILICPYTTAHRYLSTNKPWSHFVFLLSLSAFSTSDDTLHHLSLIHSESWTLGLRSREKHIYFAWWNTAGMRPPCFPTLVQDMRPLGPSTLTFGWPLQRLPTSAEAS